MDHPTNDHNPTNALNFENGLQIQNGSICDLYKILENSENSENTENLEMLYGSIEKKYIEISFTETIRDEERELTDEQKSQWIYNTISSHF